MIAILPCGGNLELMKRPKQHTQTSTGSPGDQKNCGSNWGFDGRNAGTRVGIFWERLC